MGSGPISDHKVFGESLPCGACVRALRRRFVQPDCTNCNLIARTTHDYFCGRLSSAALRWPRAQENIGFQGFNLEWGSRALHKAASGMRGLRLRIEKLRLCDATTLSASSPAHPHA